MRGVLHIALVASAMLPVAQSVVASQLEAFDGACVGYRGAFTDHSAALNAQGWQVDERHPVLAQAVQNYQSISRYKDLRGFAKDGLHLMLATDGSIVVCSVIAPDAKGPIDKNTFDARYDPLTNANVRQMNLLRAVYFADATAAPIPRDPILGDKRPKVDRGLVGQLMSASWFAQ